MGVADNYELHPTTRKNYLAGRIVGGVILLLSCGAIIAAPVHSVGGILVEACIGTVLIVWNFYLAIRRAIVVEVDARIVRREYRMFDRVLIWSQNYPFSDFAAVTRRHVLLREGGDRYVVSLALHSGESFPVCYMDAALPEDPGLERRSGELAYKLSCDLQIPTVETKK